MRLNKEFELLCVRSSRTRLLTLDKPVEPRHEKINILVSDLVRLKPGCTATEDG